jgi:hypothetical protein
VGHSAIACASGDVRARVWDLGRGVFVGFLGASPRDPEAPGAEHVVRWVPSAGTIVTYDRTLVAIWDASTATRRAKIPLASGVVAVSPDGSRIATAEPTQRRALYDGTTGALVKELAPPTPSTPSESDLQILFSPDSASVLYEESFGSATMWDARTGTKRRHVFGAKLTGYQPMEFSPDSASLAVGFEEGALELYDVKSGAWTKVLRAGARQLAVPNGRNLDAAQRLAWSPDGALLAEARVDRAIEVWDVKRGTLARTLEAPDPSGESIPVGLGFRADGAFLGWAFDGGQVRAWNARGAADAIEVRANDATAGTMQWGADKTSLEWVPTSGPLVERYDPATGARGAANAIDKVEGMLGPDERWKAEFHEDLRLLRATDGAALGMRVLMVGGTPTGVFYREDGRFTGDASVCQKLAEHVNESGAEIPLTTAECAALVTPTLVADFLAGR